ncbi:hypothetical protein JTB14_002491 [Gonioctena quinquepunctata]|nr:hypothetical protein JTB14_002491 [Gonioctena quinquepunctata]
MQVRGGSKIRNLLTHALNEFPEAKHIIWTGFGPSVGKCITCAEIMKRECNNSLHQITKLCFRQVEEYWDPLLPELDQLVVKRKLPMIHIYLSKDALNTEELGYQAPGEKVPYQSDKNRSTNGRTKLRRPTKKQENRKQDTLTNPESICDDIETSRNHNRKVSTVKTWGRRRRTSRRKGGLPPGKLGGGGGRQLGGGGLPPGGGGGGNIPPKGPVLDGPEPGGPGGGGGIAPVPAAAHGGGIKRGGGGPPGAEVEIGGGGAAPLEVEMGGGEEPLGVRVAEKAAKVEEVFLKENCLEGGPVEGEVDGCLLVSEEGEASFPSL